MIEGCLAVSASSGGSQAAVHRGHEDRSEAEPAVARGAERDPDEDQDPGGVPHAAPDLFPALHRDRLGVREDSGNPVPVCQDRSGADLQADSSSADPRGGEAQGAEAPAGTPVSAPVRRNAAAEPVSEAAARVSEEEAVPDGDAGAAVAARDAGEGADAVPAGRSPRFRSTRRKAHRHTPRSLKAG